MFLYAFLKDIFKHLNKYSSAQGRIKVRLRSSQVAHSAGAYPGFRLPRYYK